MATASCEVPTAFSVNGTSTSFMEMHKKFAGTSWGEKLSVTSRWGLFKPPDLTTVEWGSILGKDVIDLLHMQLSLGISRWFLWRCENPPDAWHGDVPEAARFSKEEQSYIQLASVKHDEAEAIIGDISAVYKEGMDEMLEFIYLYDIEKVLNTDNPQLFEAVTYVIDTVLKDKDSKLGRAFNAVEGFGYHRTAIRAWQQSRNRNVKSRGGDIRRRLRALAISVHTHQMLKMREYSEVYPPIYSHLLANRDTISKIYDLSANYAARTVHQYEKRYTIRELSSKFARQKEEWQKWVDEHPDNII